MCWIMERALLKNRQGLPSFLGPELCYRHWEHRVPGFGFCFCSFLVV